MTVHATRRGNPHRQAFDVVDYISNAGMHACTFKLNEILISCYKTML